MFEATVGLEALFWVAPPGDPEDPTGAYAHFDEVAARAVTTNRISRVVFQSSVGAELRHGAGEIHGLARAEELLDATGASVTHLRCGMFFSNLVLSLEDVVAGTLSVIVPVDQPMPWVAPLDIAEVAVLRLLSTSWSGREIQAVHGPCDLTWDEVALIVTEATGYTVRAQQIPDSAMREALEGAGLTAAGIEGLMGMSTGLRDGLVPSSRAI